VNMFKRRFLLLFGLAVLLVGLPPGRVSAAMYTMNAATAAQLRDVSWSDASEFGANVLRWVGYNPGDAANRVYGIGAYGEDMFYSVGFVGNLTDSSSPYDALASVKIGVAGTPAQAAITNAGGVFAGFYLPISNDDDDTWEYKLYAT